ncbi:hypothetical protein ACGFIV_35600 [Sphaerisporangium sp. NPDC049003]|uniref:hypothetical protein n=1 Tax=Sphaerisporangium sp. NPDC049003 TaxID=3364517 RepID=UPI00371E148E
MTSRSDAHGGARRRATGDCHAAREVFEHDVEGPGPSIRRSSSAVCAVVCARSATTARRSAQFAVEAAVAGGHRPLLGGGMSLAIPGPRAARPPRLTRAHVGNPAGFAWRTPVRIVLVFIGDAAVHTATPDGFWAGGHGRAALTRAEWPTRGCG